MSDKGVSRRDLLRKAGLGEAALLGGSLLGAAARDDTAMVELKLHDYGRYMFHPHQHWLADRGAMGWFATI